MNELNTLLTSDQSEEPVAFWKQALGAIGGDFQLRQNGRSYAAREEQALEHELTLDDTTVRFLDELAHGKDIGVFVIVLAGVAQLARIYSGSRTIRSIPPR